MHNVKLMHVNIEAVTGIIQLLSSVHSLGCMLSLLLKLDDNGFTTSVLVFIMIKRVYFLMATNEMM